MQFKTLIVDDEPLARMRMRKLLESYSDLVTIVGEASTGEEAIAQIRAGSPDLVFLDIQMPDMNGFDVLKEGGEEAPAEGGEEANDDFGSEEGGEEAPAEETSEGGDEGGEGEGESTEGGESDGSEGESSEGDEGESKEGGEDESSEEAPADETKSENFNFYHKKGQPLDEDSDYIIGKLYEDRFDKLEPFILSALKMKIRNHIEEYKKQVRIDAISKKLEK